MEGAVKDTIKQCQLCHLRTSSMSFLLRHLAVVHSTQPGFFFSCGLNGCHRTFRNITTYRHHVYARHPKDHTNLVVPSTGDTAGARIHDDEQETRDDNELMEDDSERTEDDYELRFNHGEQSGTSYLNEATATFILKTKEKHKIPQSVICNIINDVTTLFQLHLGNIGSIVKQQLKAKNVDDDIVASISGILDPDGENGRPFKGLETEHQQQKYFREKFSMIEPETVVLGTERKMKGCGEKRKCVEVRDEMKYVPLLSTLESLLQNKNILQEVEVGHKSDDDQVLKDYCDGQHCGSHPLNHLDPQWLQIFLYFDELELCNPLGSKRSIHKIGAFYFTLGNISPKYRSKLKSIQLLALVKNSLIKKYGMNSVLEPIVKDLKALENGCEFIISGSPRVFYGTLCIVSADNPASCSLGGFKESVSANHPCRQCLASKGELKLKFRPSIFNHRTPELHEEHLQKLEDPTEDFNARSKEYGVNRRSVLSELKYFDVTSGSLMPDVMLDVLEGVLQFEAKLLLRQFIHHDHYFTLAQLNQQIEALELGFSEVKNRPTPISHATLQEGDNHLKQSASQMWLLGRLLPQMIGHWIPRENEHWLSYLRLLEIADILLAPCVAVDDVALLSVLVQDHHVDFLTVYPNAPVIPKMHFIIHVAQIMRQYGPSRQHWTMRYESKHSYFKQLANSLGNYINICHTLSIRHEQLHCYLRMENSLCSMETETGPVDN